MRNVTRIRRFREQDAGNIVKRIDNLVPDNDASSLILTASSGFTYTIVIDDVPAAIAGINIMWPGVAQVWAITSDLIRGHGIFYTKMVDRVLRLVAKEQNVRRYHCIVDSGRLENIRWLYTLKFSYEFCMRKAAPNGTDVFGFVRWENGNG